MFLGCQRKKLGYEQTATKRPTANTDKSYLHKQIVLLFVAGGIKVGNGNGSV